MALRIYVGTRWRQMHIVAVLADRKEHTIRDMVLSPMLTASFVGEVTSTREALAPLIWAGYVDIVGRMKPTAKNGPLFIYRLADRTGERSG